MSENDEEHLEHLRLVFDDLNEHGLMMRLDKCHFFQKELIYLGSIVNEFGSRPGPAYVDKLFKIKKPTDKPTLLSIIGMIQWLGKYIPRLSDWIWPLTSMTKPSVPFQWNDHCDMCFAKIKSLARNANILRHPDMEKPF